MTHIAYLFPEFPVLHQTFTVGEVLGLRREGRAPRLVALKRRGEGLQQKEAQELVGETFYCPRLCSRELLSCFARALWSQPRATIRLFVSAFSAWRERPRGRREEHATGGSTLTIGERLLAVYHCNPYVYLVKSLLLVPYAVYLSEWMHREGVRHVHAHWATYPTTVAYLIHQWCGIRYSFTAHAYDIYMMERMLPAKLARAEFVVTCAETNKRYLASLCEADRRAPILVNYHGTDLGRFRFVERDRERCYRIVSCGWLKEYKGFHLLLRAVARLVERGIDASLAIAGDGPQRSYLERLARELGIADRVTLHGYLRHDQIFELYRGADVFALPSVVLGRYGRQDVIPNVLAEAMSVGLPVIGSAIGGVPELVTDGLDGLLVPQRDVEALADALERIWHEPETAARLAKAGRSKVEQIWDREKNLRQLGKFFDTYAPMDPEGLAA